MKDRSRDGVHAAVPAAADHDLQVAAIDPFGGWHAFEWGLVGAMALGHPLGANGAVRVATLRHRLLHRLRQRKQKYGTVTI